MTDFLAPVLTQFDKTNVDANLDLPQPKFPTMNVSFALAIILCDIAPSYCIFWKI